MCAQEVPDVYDSIAEPYAEQLTTFFVNAGEDEAAAREFLNTQGLTQRAIHVLLDSQEAVYRSYPWNDSWAPFPVHVVIDREGEVVYFARQLDAVALKAAIDEALAQP